MIDAYVTLILAHRRNINQVLPQFKDAVIADLIALNVDGYGNPIIPAIAPNVTANDEDNTIIGITNKMEYAIDGADYTIYDEAVVLDLSGEHTANVRVSAVVIVTSASLPTTLIFTTN